MGALGLPLRPALYLTITVPFADSSAITPRVWERIIQLQPNWTDATSAQVLTRRVVIAGIVKSATTTQPLTETIVLIPDTDKRTVSNQAGLFFFEDLHDGNYRLNVQHPGYLSRSCNVLVDDSSTTFKEILLFPVS